jgi:hypothetical protein
MSKLNVLKGVMIALVIIGVSGCTSTKDIEVKALTSEKVNLDGYKTYEIIEGSGIVDNTQRSDNLDIDAEMKQMINTELANKGKMLVNKDPDFYVAYVAGTDMDAIEEKINKDGQKTLHNRPASGMILILIDADTGAIIGLSAAEGEAKNLPAKEAKKRLNYAIKKMLSEI